MHPGLSLLLSLLLPLIATGQDQVRTLAGLPGTPGTADGPSEQARFNDPAGIAVGPDGRAYIADSRNHVIRVITTEGIAKPKLDGHWMPEGFGGAMGELLCAIAEDRQPFNSAAHNLESLKAAFALIASVDEGRQIKVGDATVAGPNCKIQD